MCQSGAREVQQKVLAKLDDDKLKAFVVWLPGYKGDNRKKALAATKIVEDHRAVHFWNSNGSLGNDFGDELSLPAKRTFAWDVYLMFDQKAEWKEKLPVPVEWMHQLVERNDPKWLDGEILNGLVSGQLHKSAFFKAR